MYPNLKLFGKVTFLKDLKIVFSGSIISFLISLNDEDICNLGHEIYRRSFCLYIY